MKDMRELMIICESNLSNDIPDYLQPLISEANNLVKILEDLELEDPFFARYARSYVSGRIDEAGLGDHLRNVTSKVKGGVNAAIGGAKKVNDYVNQLGSILAKTGPVQRADQKIEALKSTVSSKFPKLENTCSQIGNKAKQHPVLQSFAIGALTVLGGLAGGPAGAAVAAGVSRAAVSMMQGDKFSSAVGKAAKTGMVGLLAGATTKSLMGILGDHAIHAFGPKIPNAPTLSSLQQLITVQDASGHASQTYVNFIGKPDEVNYAAKLLDQAKTYLHNKDWSKAANIFSQLKELQIDPRDAAASYSGNHFNFQFVSKALSNDSKAYDTAVSAVLKCKTVMGQLAQGLSAIAAGGAVAAQTNGVNAPQSKASPQKSRKQVGFDANGNPEYEDEEEYT